MLEALRQLLILQERDRKILRSRAELASIRPQDQLLHSKALGAQAALDAAKLQTKQIETERKRLELEVEAKKLQIEKYSLQQFQTKKNEEYRALAHEIEVCKEVIAKLEDGQLECMEQADAAQKELLAATKLAQELKANTDAQLADLAAREKNLAAELAGLEADRDQLTTAVEEGALARYERLLQHRGENVVVGIEHGVCGGCHMKLTTQAMVSCQGDREIVTCPNCGRILYYTRDMELAIVD
jgi:predicted  nucleic acid-binding Zn-ribbon protein